jgi:polyisoprenoid-binding protein YceI
MNWKRVGLGVGAVVVLVVAALAVYLWQLTAPVQVAQTAPVAPTLAVPAATPAADQGAPPPAGQGTPAAGAQGGGPPGGMNGFPPGTPGPAGMGGPGGFPPPMGGDAARVSTSPPAAPTPASASGAAAVYRIDPAQSSAAYSVSETFTQAFAGMQPGKVTTVGTTKAVAGDILLDPTNPAASRLGEIVVDISQFQSDIGMRDNAIRRQWLESARYPLATFQNATLTGLPATWPQGQPVTFQIAGDLTVHGTTQHVVWNTTATLDGGTLRAEATTTVKMSEFGVQAPSMPMLSVEDPVTLTLKLVAPPIS